MKTDMKKTQENNGKGCSKKGCLSIEIYKHFTEPHTYVVWHKKEVIGFINEDQALQVLNKDELVDFYFNNKSKFKVEKSKIEKYLKRDDK